MTSRRIAVYIDAANIILSLKEINFNLDIDSLFIYLKDKYKNSKIIFFIGDVYYLKEIKDILIRHGIEICIKETSKEGGKVKANCDVEITQRIVVDVERNLADDFILLSGDGDFIGLFNYIFKMGKQAYCIAPTFKSTSIFIKRRQSLLKVIYLEQKSFLKYK